MRQQALSLILRELDEASNSVNVHNDKMDECIASMEAESLRMTHIVDKLVEIYSKPEKCKVIPFVKPSILRSKNNNNPALRVSLI